LGTFDFLCKECNLKFEFTILGNSESAEPYCPECLGRNVIKLFSPPKVVIGLESVSVNSELYFRPDKPPNPAKMWRKFAYN
jgi:putative FmdB family regulatory protein